MRGVLAAPDGGAPVEDGGRADEGGEEVGVEAEDVSPVSSPVHCTSVTLKRIFLAADSSSSSPKVVVCCRCCL